MYPKYGLWQVTVKSSRVLLEIKKMSGYNLYLLVKKSRQETREDEEEREIQKYQSQTLTSLQFFSSVYEVTSVVPISLKPNDCHASLSMGFSRQEFWSGLPGPLPGDLPKPGIERVS